MAFLKISAIFVLTVSIFDLTLSKPHVRIMGGTPALPGQFPFIASLNYYIAGYGSGHVCGASIIHPQWLVTAAHCLIEFSSKELYIQSDTIDLNSGGQNYTVALTVSHEDYDHTISANDIGLVKITGKIKFSATAKIIEIDEAIANETCQVIGWGSNGKEEVSNLAYGNSTALTEKDCAQLAIGGTYNFKRGPGQICGFDSDGTSPCHGDSGGPLMCHGKLIGIVSYGIEPCVQTYPDVYTRTAYYREWIQKIVSTH